MFVNIKCILNIHVSRYKSKENGHIVQESNERLEILTRLELVLSINENKDKRVFRKWSSIVALAATMIS